MIAFFEEELIEWAWRKENRKYASEQWHCLALRAGNAALRLIVMFA